MILKIDTIAFEKQFSNEEVEIELSFEAIDKVRLKINSENTLLIDTLLPLQRRKTGSSVIIFDKNETVQKTTISITNS